MALDTDVMETQETEVPEQGVVAYHVHLEEPPYCRSWSKAGAQDKAYTFAVETGGELLGPLTYRAADCPHLLDNTEATGEQEQEAPPAEPESSTEAADAVIEQIDEAEASEIDPTLAALYGSPAVWPTAPGVVVSEEDDQACAVCGEPLDAHTHPGQGGSASPQTKTRRAPDAYPPCPHCGGKIHYNESGAKVNFECLFRQQLVAEGVVTNPLVQKLPVATAKDVVTLGRWIEERVNEGVDLRYGKMESPSGTAGTFASMRPKPAPKPKRSAPVPSLEAVAQEEATTAVLTSPALTPAEVEPESSPEQIKAERRKARRDKLKNVKK